MRQDRERRREHDKACHSSNKGGNKKSCVSVAAARDSVYGQECNVGVGNKRCECAAIKKAKQSKSKRRSYNTSDETLLRIYNDGELMGNKTSKLKNNNPHRKS